MDTELALDHVGKHSEALYDFADRITTLSTGALALSITFRKDIAGASPAAIWLLQSSWAAFTIAVICCTIYRFSKAKAHAHIVQAVLKGETRGIMEVGLFYDICFLIARLTFLCGVVALVAFAVKNT